MKEPKFKKGEWCFCEFKLQQVMETEDDRITSVSDGMFHMGGCDLSDRCYPLDMDIKQASDNVAYWSKEFHALKNNALNHPDLNRELISRWCDWCDNIKDSEKSKEIGDNLSSFGNSVVKKVRDLSFEEIEGVNLFRR